MDKLLLVDGNSIANRAFYALPFLSNHEGKPSGAVYGFANILIKLIQEERPSHIIIAFDHARKTFRNEIYSEYKMQRKATPVELLSQFPIIKEMLSSMDITVIEQAGIEADDILGTLSKKYDGFKIILSGDRDLLQLINDNTNVWLTKKGVSEVEKVDEQRLKELYGIKPYQVIEMKALMGDTSDNIPGVKGIGEKTALSLIEKYNDVQNLYDHIDEISGKLKEKLENDKDMAFTSKTLATIKTDCELSVDFDDCKLKFPFAAKTYEFFKQMDFSSLLKNSALYSDVQPKESEAEKIEKVVLNKEFLDSIDLTNIKEFCYNLSTMEFLINNKIYYLEKNFSMFSELDLDDIIEKIGELFKNEKVFKITKSAKQDMHILAKYDIQLNNFFDISVADYIINAGLKSNIDNIELLQYHSQYELLLNQLKENSLDFIYSNIEKPLIKILFEMEENGFKINQDILEMLDNEFTNKIDSISKEIYIQADEEFNINSPKQVASILFDKLGIKSYNNKKQSTNANILEELRYIPIVENILNYRKYTKLKNTYIDVYKKLINENGDIIHTTFNQTLTSTGRLSSSEPNLQNIPTRNDEGKNLRKLFVSKFENGKIISADYNQIELRLLADMSEEGALIEAYQKGNDIHSMTASQIFGVPIDEVTSNQRREAKAVNFGIIYGISDYGLSQNIKSTRAKAKEYIDSYFKKYPKVHKFMEDNVSFAKEKGYAITKYGRRRKIPELSSSKYITRTFGERVAMNMPLQGTASDIIKLAMIQVSKTLKEKNMKSQLILQIHDELIVDTYPGEEQLVEKILKQEMENVASLKVPLIVSIGEGNSLFDCK